MMPVSILHLVSALTPGGRDRVLLELLSRLDPQLFHIRVASLTPLPEGIRDDFAAARLHPITVPFSLAHRERSLPSRVVARCRDVGALRAYLRRARPQIVHTHGPFLNAYGGIAARLAGVPHLMSHDHDATAGAWRERIVERWAARLPDVAFVSSSAVAAARRERLHRAGVRVLRLPTGVDLRAFQPASPTQRLAARLELGIPADAFVIGTLGQLLPRKRAGILVEALPALLTTVPHAHLVVAGDGPERQRLTAQASALGLGARLIELPWRRDVTPVYRALDVFVSLGEGGSGRTLAEAMACGLPVVARHTAVHAEMAAEAAVWVEARPRAVAQALGVLARSASERTRLGASARSRAARHLDIAAAARLLETAYAHSVARTPRPWTSKELLPAR